MNSAVLSDRALSRRLERAEGRAGARFVEARARAAPSGGAQWIEVAGAYAMFDGPDSPSTQTFGLGLFQQPAPADLDRLESFFSERGAPVFHEVSPLADRSLLGILPDRGYRPVDLTSVLFLPVNARAAAGTGPGSPLQVRAVAASEREVWARTAAQGWQASGPISDSMLEVFRLSVEGTVCFLAEWNGLPIAAASLILSDGVALCAGASTIVEWRHRGAQRALLGYRLDYAAAAGCDLAMVCAEPGSESQRNAERNGFRIAYTRVKWGRAMPRPDVSSTG